ncbi:hypothetical protein DPMN_038805 [Dreissena polymorpha]|uniref:Uncharacterized protein n=1 Tax=Dreissena polymorpha TaxID=45954 RepID=A0A9D4RR33_DREPO|nr:hypothetical protein DPMN_038805 [Dreissena polymorpha]
MTSTFVTGDDVKIRRRSHRDLYVKKRKEKPKSGRAAQKGKRWVFLDILSVLEQYLQEDGTDSNMSHVDKTIDDEDSVYDTQSMADSQVEFQG